MRTRTLLLILLLYSALVWVWSAYQYRGEQIVQKGLFGTAIGIGTVLALLLLERAWIGYQTWRARQAKLPPRPKTPVAAIHEDDRALAALWEEARRNLAASPEFGRHGRGLEFSHLPLILVVGPSSAGKSSTLLNSGMDPQLLAGQTRGDHHVTATRVANIFLSKNALFVEIGGRIWDSDVDRWTEFLRGFRDEPTGPWWRRLWHQEPGKPRVRGVILFEDFGLFSEKADSGNIGNLSKRSQERLQAISEMFGMAVPVYVVFAKSDSTPFFKDFFARMPSPECGQPLGAVLAEHSNTEAQTADQATRWYMRAFNAVASRLAERRVLHLSRESDASRKPAVYQFPREFRRARSALVQFLSEAFRPNPLRISPFLRGVYFTGIRLVEATPAPTPTNWTPALSSAGLKTDATTIFRPEATEIFRPGMAKSEVSPSNHAAKQQWMFAKQLFEEIVPFDRLPQRAPRVGDSGLGGRRQILSGALFGIAFLLSLIWLQSWWSNHGLVAEAKDVAAAASGLTRQADGRISMSSLETLEALRQQVTQLEEPPSWRMRWGLYAGDSVQQTMRRHYFERFNTLLLEDLNRYIVDKLGRLPEKAGTADPFEPAYSELATHLRITSGSCKTNAAVVSGVLKTAAVQSGIAGEGTRRELVDRQIDYYSLSLDKEPPRLSENTGAVAHARDYLSQIKSPERFYAAIREELSGKLTRTAKLADMVPEYQQVLAGKAEVPELFSARGRELFEKELSNPNRQLAADSCVLGATRAITGDPEMEKKLRSLYADDYKAAWKEFLSKMRVHHYSGLQDASRKLEILSGQRSPILGVMGFASNNTYFVPPGQPADLKETIVTKAKEAISGKADPIAKQLEKQQQKGSPDPIEQIREAFQPVHALVQPGSEKWASEVTKPYLNALAEYRLSLQAIARSSSSAADPAVHQAALAARDKAFEVVRQLSLAFEPIGTDGIDAVVRDLLEQPIRYGSTFIVANPEKAAEGKLNAQLSGLCTLMRPTLAKYPFTRTATAEASLEDMASLFTPGSGAIWKYQQDSLGEYVVRQENRWVQKPEAQKPRISDGVLDLLNRAQLLSSALYPAGSGQSTLAYSLRPAENSIPDQISLEFNFDGRTASFAKGNVLRKEFQWPPAARASSRAVAKVITPSFSFPFASGSGIWGVFRVFADAEPRALNDKNIEWKYNRVAGGQQAPMDPPVRMQFVDFPGGVDLFNPALWGRFQCPGRATQ